MNARILVIALVSVFASAMAFATGGGAKDAHGKKPAAAAKKKKDAHGEEHHDEHGEEHHEEKAAH